MMTKKPLPYLNRGQDRCRFLHGGRGRFSTDLFQCLVYVDHAQSIYMGGPRRYSDEKLTTRNGNYCDIAIELPSFQNAISGAGIALDTVRGKVFPCIETHFIKEKSLLERALFREVIRQACVHGGKSAAKLGSPSLWRILKAMFTRRL
eukprot:scaffold1378_cov101-Alexandrium_tamarense.AAC.4